jgi:DNA-directed RNA polymerase specialized sigma subunit
MQDFAYYRPITLSEADSLQLKGVMVAAYPHLSRAAIEKYGSPKPLIKRLRDAYKKNASTLWFDPMAKLHMDRLMEIEEPVIRSNICLGTNLCNKLSQGWRERPDVTYDDYLQQVAWAIYDAMYTYSGESEFSTYAHKLIHNRLVSYVRDHDQKAGIGRRIKWLKLKARKLMQSDGLTFDQVAARMRKEDGLSEDDVDKLRASMYKVCGLDEPLVNSLGTWERGDDVAELVRYAIEQAGLNDLERELVEAYMNDDRDCRRRIVTTRIHPNTGRPYTPQRLSQIFLEACTKIREVYERLCSSMAA